MARLNNEQKLQIQKLILKNKTISEISKETGLKEAAINEYVDKLLSSLQKIEESKEAAKKKEESKPSGPKAINLMGTHTSGKRNKGVAVMTKEASERLDEARKSTNNRKLDSCIFRPNDKQQD